jgi:hypothetical protein
MSTLGPPAAVLLDSLDGVEEGELDTVDAVGSTLAELVVSLAFALDEESVAIAVKAAAGDAAMRHSARDKSPPAHTDHQ